MKRHLCIWLPNCRDPNEQLSSTNAAPKKGSGPFVSLEAVAWQVQQQICPLTAIETLEKKPWAQRFHAEPVPHRPESLLCDITGVTHLFDDEAGLISAVDHLLSSMKISGLVAIADSVGAAWGMAHYGNRGGRSSTGANGADAARALPSRIVPPGETRQAIEPLPVESLRIEQETAATLSRLGVHDVGQLLRLPRSGLAPRLGKPLVRRMEQILGEVDEPIAVYRASVEHTASHRLDYPTSDQWILSDRIERLVKEVRAGMATCQRGALRITCRLDFSAHPPLTLEVGLFAPTIDADHLCGLIVHQLEAARLPAAVERLTLFVPLTGPLCSTQIALFDRNSNDADSFPRNDSSNGISRLVDSLGGRLGCESVVGVQIKDNPLPEKSFSVFPLAGNRRTGNRLAVNGASSVRPRMRSESSSHFLSSSDSPAHRSPSPHDAMRRPLALLAEPIPIAVSHNDGPFRFVVSSAALPDRIRVGGAVHSIVRSWGAERIETSWWNGPSIRRDYYRIEIDSANWWWVFRNLAFKNDGYRWMLHGRFN